MIKKANFFLIAIAVIVTALSGYAENVKAYATPQQVINTPADTSKTRDAKRKSDLSAIQLALEKFYKENSTYRIPGAGANYTGEGWITEYVLPIRDALSAPSRGLNPAIGADPSPHSPIVTNNDHGYMLYLCDDGQSYSLSASLEIDPGNDPANKIVGACNSTGDNSIITNYRKNYAVTGTHKVDKIKKLASLVLILNRGAINWPLYTKHY